MRRLSQLFTLVFVLSYLNSAAQSDIQQDWRVDPLLKQIDAKRPGLKMFGRKDGRGGYVNMSVLNESTRKLKWFTCHGVAFDSVQLQADEYDQVLAGTLDPFTFYRSYCLENLFYIEQAEIMYRINGKAALKDTSYNNRTVYNATPVRSAQSTLQKLVAMEGLMKRICLQLRLFDSRTPRLLFRHRNDSSRIRQKLAGVMTRRTNSTEYFNTDPLATAAKIVLRQQVPDKLFVYDQEEVLMDSVPLKPGKYASLLKEKEDVFLLYRGWLELQWQQVADSKRQYAVWLQKLDSSLYKSVSWDQSKQQLQNIAISLQERQNSIDGKISSLIIPEEKYVERLVADFYPNENSEISYLSGVGFAYSISYIRGQKAYELTDHRGNVMAVITDKKKGAEENTDGIVEYYNADVVSATDYYPFGAIMPGRTFSAESKYRYGYNGKENDNEVKGEGNQQDYGIRVFDPRIGRFLSIDPLTKQYPELTPFQFASNSPIAGIDLDGREFDWFMNEWLESKIFGTTHLKTIRKGFVARAEETLNGVKKLPGAIDQALESLPLRTTIADPNISKGNLFPQVKHTWRATKAVVNDFSDLVTRAGKGDEEAIGALAFETAMLAVPGGEEIRAEAMAAKFENAVSRVSRRLMGLKDRKLRDYEVKYFGSRIKGTNRPDSDLDVLILTEQTELFEQGGRLDKILESIIKDFKKETGVDLDVNIMERSTYNQAKGGEFKVDVERHAKKVQRKSSN